MKAKRQLWRLPSEPQGPGVCRPRGEQQLGRLPLRPLPSERTAADAAPGPLPALPPRGPSPSRGEFTRVPWQPRLHQPCRERWRKVSLTCLEIFRPGMEAARKIFTLFVLIPERFGSRASSEKYQRLLPRHQFRGLVRDKRACFQCMSMSVPSVCGTLFFNP